MVITSITTVTTVTTIAAMGLTAAISIGAVASLVAFLVTKELVGANGSGSLGRMARFLNVGIYPLVIVLGVFIAIKISEVMA